MQEREATVARMLQTGGLLSAQDLATRLSVSQPTVSRTLSGLGSRIARFGSGRSTRYGLRRSIGDLGQSWPIYRIGANGANHLWGDLEAVFGGFVFRASPDCDWIRYLSEERTETTVFFHGLPFFLSDVRPQGFIGRAVARSISQARGTPDDPRRWTDDVILLYLHDYGHDLSGNSVVGDRMLQRALGSLRTDVVLPEERETAYADSAARATAGFPPGSSAGGEQPKFPAYVQRNDGRRDHVLVKFSPVRDTPQGQRWSDLLVAEAISSEVLRTAGIEAAAGTVVDAAQRTFLEVGRFDRSGEFGRRGVLSLEAVAVAFGDGADANWIDVSNALERRNLLTAQDARRLRSLWWYGHLIGNSDMHLGNVSLWFGDEPLPLRLAPAYDMLPMLFAPSTQGEIVTREFAIPVPLPQHLEIVRDMLPIAVLFWLRVSEDLRISEAFRAMAARTLGLVRQWAARFAADVRE